MWNFIVGLAFMIIGYLLMPKPKGPKPAEVSEMDAPTAEAGIEVTVVFGDIMIQQPNFLGWWDKTYVKRKESVGKK